MTSSTDKPIVKDENLNDIVENKETNNVKDKLEINEGKIKKKKSIWSIFKKSEKKERIFDENEKIDCISKVIGNYGN